MANQFLPMFTFRIPQSQNTVNFSAAFSKSSEAEQTRQFVDRLDDKRAVFCSALEHLNNEGVEPEGAVTALTEYIPDIYMLLDAINALPQNVPLQRTILFEWLGGFQQLNKSVKYSQSVDIAFEIIMALHAKSISLHILAKRMMDRDTKNSPDASKRLREAAGICKFMANDVIPKWMTNIHPWVRCPESLVEINSGMCIYFEAVAQQAALMKAVQGGSTTTAVLARLALGVSEKIKLVIVRFDKASVKLDRTFLRHIVYLRELYEAIAKAYKGDVSYNMKPCECGKALSYYESAVQQLRHCTEGGNPWSMDTIGRGDRASTRFPSSGIGLPLEGYDPYLSPALFKLREFVLNDLLTKHKTLVTENKVVFHQVVPPLDMAGIGTPAYVMTATDMERPTSTQLPSFTIPPSVATNITSGILSLFSGFGLSGDKTDKSSEKTEGDLNFSSGSSTSSVGGAPSAPPSPSQCKSSTSPGYPTVAGVPAYAPHVMTQINNSNTSKTDRELALELQKQYDMERDEMRNPPR